MFLLDAAASHETVETNKTVSCVKRFLHHVAVWSSRANYYDSTAVYDELQRPFTFSSEEKSQISDATEVNESSAL